MTVDRALEMPFYHPVIEEALQDALIELRAQLAAARRHRRIWWLRPRRLAPVG
jgi:hypothetical protein